MYYCIIRWMDRWRIAPLFVDFFSFSFFFFFFFEWWIAVPPDILVNQSSSDQVASEGDNVSLICAATGYPDPKITWRREDNQLINARGISVVQFNESNLHFDNYSLTEALVEGSTLNLADVTRQQMGAYLCIASNGSFTYNSSTNDYFNSIVVHLQVFGLPLASGSYSKSNVSCFRDWNYIRFKS